MKPLHTYKILLLFISFLLTKNISACQCPLTQLSKAECNKYELIFRGKVVSVAPCNDKPGLAVFEIQDLYKGNLPKNFKVIFDCNDPCANPLHVGEEWIIYTRYKQIDNALLNWCSRSRKFIANAKEDFYAVTYGNSYDEEIKFLQDSLGLHRLLKQDPAESGHRNKIPNVNQSIIILICSILVVLLFYYLFNKFFK